MEYSMTTATKSVTPEAAREDWNFNTSTSIALFFAAALLIAIIFMPWIGTKISINAMRLLSDNLYGTVGAIPAPYIWIVPSVALVAICMALLGTLAPENARLASIINTVLGLAGLSYYWLNANWPVLTDPRFGGAGLGYRVALITFIGLVIQIGFAAPPLNALLQKINSAVA